MIISALPSILVPISTLIFPGLCFAFFFLFVEIDLLEN